MTLQHHLIAGAPDPVAPFSHAVEADGWIYLAGQMPFSGTSINEPYPQGIAAQTHQVMHNLKAILQQANMDFSNVVKTTIFITDMHQFGAVNEVYGKYFETDFPARETVQVSALPKFVNVEISMIVVK